MLSFPSQNDKKKFSDRPGELEKTDRVTANQQIFKSGLTLVLVTDQICILVAKEIIAENCFSLKS